MEGGWFDDEAIEQERFDADMLQAQYEEESRVFWNDLKAAARAFEAGDLARAASLCHHGGGYPLDSPAAEYEEDPGVGEDGWRCSDCGSRLSTDPWSGGTVTVPCELGESRFKRFAATGPGE